MEPSDEIIQQKELKEVLLITDGACIGNPGPGGWACILRYKQHVTEIHGGEPYTTNNRMELRAVIEGLMKLTEPCSVKVKTDSQYLVDGMTKWITNWKAKDWFHKVKCEGWQPVKNRDLWEEIDRLQQGHRLQWEWVRGHSVDHDNNRCDLLANNAARRMSVVK